MRKRLETVGQACQEGQEIALGPPSRPWALHYDAVTAAATRFQMQRLATHPGVRNMPALQTDWQQYPGCYTAAELVARVDGHRGIRLRAPDLGEWLLDSVLAEQLDGERLRATEPAVVLIGRLRP